MNYSPLSKKPLRMALWGYFLCVNPLEEEGKDHCKEN